MSGISKIGDAAERVSRMAETLGVHLGVALVDGDLTAEGYRDAVLRCSACAEPEACARFLDRHVAAEAAPGYCRNGQHLQDLARAVTDPENFPV